MCTEQDYTEGYDKGHEDGFKAGFVDAGRTIVSLEKSLRAALEIINAYGENEGYLPGRCADAVQVLREAGFAVWREC
jgi:flagellar biosynthesis/type III secretory pathway protein FliH